MHSYGTVHQLTCPGTFQQNGRVKQKLRHILDTVRTFLLSTKVPAPFWGETAFYAIHAINRIPSPVIQSQTLYEHLFGSPPDYHHLRVLLVSFFFSHMSITNLSPGQGFVVFLAMVKLKRGIGVMILSLIVFISPAMLSFRNIIHLSSSFTSLPPYLPSLS